MGPQSQFRVSNIVAANRLADSNRHNKKRKTTADEKVQGAINFTGGVGERAFDPAKDCKQCKAKALAVALGTQNIPHRKHDPRCSNNRRTKGVTSETTLAENINQRRLQRHFSTPLTAAEKADRRYTLAAAVASFFAPRRRTNTNPTREPTPQPNMEVPDEIISQADGNSFCKAVNTKLEDQEYCKATKKKCRAPLAMAAFAKVVEDTIIHRREYSSFNGLTLQVPACPDMYNSPQYHSIVGQKLLLVDWINQFGLEVPCPCCDGVMVNKRTNYSKNKILFPIFGIDGPPQWCMVQHMECSSCGAKFSANEAPILAGLPPYAAQAYPVETKYALSDKRSHLARSVTDILDLIMVTYTNGELCSRLLYDSINRSFKERVADYYSYPGKRTKDYIAKDGEYIRSNAYPPLGDALRRFYDEAANNRGVPWKVSDKDRHTREIQGVPCSLLFAEDITHEIVKNYHNRKDIGAVGCWNQTGDAGQIACAVLVTSTKTKSFAHAAKQVSLREGFKPKAMYNDRWPIKIPFWESLYGRDFPGRLGLFHFQQRIVKTLRKTHPNYWIAIHLLRMAVYRYNTADYDKLTQALLEGTLGDKVTEAELIEMTKTKTFRDRYDKHLRKEILPGETIKLHLQEWFDKFKSSNQRDKCDQCGRIEPTNVQPLFTRDTYDAIRMAKMSCFHLQDPLPLDAMYCAIPPSPNSPHGLTEYLSRRGESNLESFHNLLAHFGNCGMRHSLADNLNLTGTARFNLAIRHKIGVSKMDELTRAKMPHGWELVVPYFNHSELQYINNLAVQAGAEKLPFQNLDPLPEDSGERFFSEYLAWMKETNPGNDLETDCCICPLCIPAATGLPVAPNATPPPTTNPPPLPRPPPPPTPTAAVPLPPPATVQVPPPPPQQAIVAPPPPLFPPTQHQYHQPQLLPAFWMQPQFWNQLPISNWHGHCCDKYWRYCQNGRKGRPPHDRNCRSRRDLTHA